ncbi:hypothetical protein OQA88_7927 [Cercophora sp. LCS_1]
MASSKPIPSRRRHDIDNVRSFLVATTIAHHAAVAYGGTGPMPPATALFDKNSALLAPYIAINQAYGLGLYFWMSGRMSAQSLSHSTSLDFIRSKLWRLGVPTVLWSVFLDPLSEIFHRPRGDLVSNLKAYVQAVRNVRGVQGPVWYTATLLIFDLTSLVLKRCFELFKSGRTKTIEFSGFAKCYALLCRWGWLAVAAGSFAVRTRFPPGRALPVINLQPSYVLQYIYAYGLGHMAFHLGKRRMTGLFDRASGRTLSVKQAFGLAVATVPIVLLPVILRSKKKNEVDEKKSDQDLAADGDEGGGLELGGWNWTAALYATWNELAFTAIGPALMANFERYHTEPARKMWSPRYSFAAFLLHSQERGSHG